MQQPRWTWSTLAIVTATVVLVFGPVFIPREVARWYLAAAANAYRVDDRKLGEHYLGRAVAWDASVVSDGDFWIAQMGSTNSDEKLRLLEKAIKIDSRCAAVAGVLAQALADEFDFERAVRAYKMAFPNGQPTRAETLNFLAYLRAQARVELDQALKDIDRALEMTGNDPALLDTKAWVLHGLRRDLEALAVSHEAIEKFEKRLQKSKTQPSAKQEAEQADDSSAEADELAGSGQLEKPLSRTERIRKEIQVAKARLGPELWNVAVLRFHRLRIYEALKRPVEASQERQWLLEHGVPIVNELF